MGEDNCLMDCDCSSKFKAKELCSRSTINAEAYIRRSRCLYIGNSLAPQEVLSGSHPGSTCEVVLLIVPSWSHTGISQIAPFQLCDLQPRSGYRFLDSSRIIPRAFKFQIDEECLKISRDRKVHSFQNLLHYEVSRILCVIFPRVRGLNALYALARLWWICSLEWSKDKHSRIKRGVSKLCWSVPFAVLETKVSTCKASFACSCRLQHYVSSITITNKLSIFDFLFQLEREGSISIWCLVPIQRSETLFRVHTMDRNFYLYPESQWCPPSFSTFDSLKRSLLRTLVMWLLQGFWLPTRRMKPAGKPLQFASAQPRPHLHNS